MQRQPALAEAVNHTFFQRPSYFFNKLTQVGAS